MHTNSGNIGMQNPAAEPMLVARPAASFAAKERRGLHTQTTLIWGFKRHGRSYSRDRSLCSQPRLTTSEKRAVFFVVQDTAVAHLYLTKHNIYINKSNTTPGEPHAHHTATRGGSNSGSSSQERCLSPRISPPPRENPPVGEAPAQERARTGATRWR